ncbi:DUF3488 and transglutaminase-like domain-containing protein [Gilvimarinus agarilyticus]|uniref:transglutaminase TgpA family protein n=1 Tax=Gilvimarinus sp. 2_MG-2023 TaxID=3062666 RepID=UPI001C0A05CB|nr:DUF3488 and transglutaminase-like domain-containing protein [Gilvimarinus sp. 2_MG-2023]MBU2885096.1 DUF3488 and transglutaminase-like domain-containing protein [Gilvimarinus agarilyticus]MDO6569993.1 DUF3488 and transglutaminase-like domain-containing protein [Gilvimarinus sp. 2_MG-2023]
MSARHLSLPVPTLGWLLITQALILLPLTVQLPIWLTGLALVVMVWRLQSSRGRWPHFGRWYKVLVALAVMAGLAATFRNLAMNAMVSLLVAGFVLKLLELHKPGDVRALSYLGYFVIGTQLLYTSGFVGSVYALLCVLVMTVTLMVNHVGAVPAGQFKPIRKVFMMSAQALPIMLALFFLVPRIGSLWTVPLNSATGTTGVSSSMSPGDIASLMQSDEVALRATFEGDIPESRQLYWRALVLDHFDGRTWSQSSIQDVKARSYTRWRESDRELQVSGKRYDYEVMLEPTDENWLYTLAAPASYSEGIWLSRGMTLYQRDAVSQRQQYSVTTHVNYTNQAEGLSELLRRVSLRIPRDSNPATRTLAEQWRRQAPNDQVLIQRFLDHIQADFSYTLQPPTLGEHSVDEFLTQTKAGFCEHFSSSFVFFMRAAGIPARVVVGYQGGRINPVEGYLTVRQLDAHAWAEVWLEGQGWVRVDPTSAVSPERIDRGVQYSLDSADSELLGDAWSRRFFMLSNLQLRLDAFNYRWHRWVMNYDKAKQKAFMQKLFGSSAPWLMVLYVMAAAGIMVVLILLPNFVGKRAQRRPFVERWYEKLCRQLAVQGYPRRSGEGARDYAQRVGQEAPELAQLLAESTALFEQAVYQNEQVSHSRLRLLLHLIKSKKYR